MYTSFEDHVELTGKFYKKLEKRYETKGTFAPNYQIGYLQGMIQSLWFILELSEKQKELFEEYIKLHSQDG